MNNARRGYMPPSSNGKVSPLEALNIAVGAANANREYDINLNEIISDQEVQVRVAGLSETKVEGYVAVLESGKKLDAVTLIRVESGEYYVADGFHRVEAHIRAGRACINAFVHQGDRDTAFEFAEEGNLRHGLELTHEDKKNVLFRRLGRPGHSWLTLSNNQLAGELGVSAPTIARWIKEFSAITNVIPDRSEIRGADNKVYSTANIGRPATPSRPDDGYTPLTPDERAKARPSLPEHHSYAPIDTGGEFPQLDDHSAAAVREGRVRNAIQQITEGADLVLQNHDIRIMDVETIEKRTALIAVIISAMVRETHFIHQLVNGLDHMACLQLQDKLARVDTAYNELGVKLADRIREMH